MIFEKLAALIAEQFNVDADSITMETSFTDDLNADSVDIVDLSMALEEEFGIEELDEEVLKEHLHPDYPGIWVPTSEWDNDYSHDRCWS